MQSKLKCKLCKRTKLRKHFCYTNSGAKHKRGDKLPHGLCRACYHAMKNHNAATAAFRKAHKESSAYEQFVRKPVREHIRKLRNSKDPAYLRSIYEARKKAQIKAINRLQELQGKQCNWEGREDAGECNYDNYITKSEEKVTTPEIDHVKGDGRNEPYFDNYRIALQVLRMANPLEKFQVLCHKHNVMKYWKEDPFTEQDSQQRGKSSAKTKKVKKAA